MISQSNRASAVAWLMPCRLAQIAQNPPLAVGYGTGKNIQSGESFFSLEWNNVEPAKVIPCMKSD
jgi:hypothetical protein